MDIDCLEASPTARLHLQLLSRGGALTRFHELQAGCGGPLQRPVHQRQRLCSPVQPSVLVLRVACCSLCTRLQTAGCNPVSQADYDGLGVRWGIGHNHPEWQASGLGLRLGPGSG